MPMPGLVDPRLVEIWPLPSAEVRFSVPLDAQEASYLAASARISSLRWRSIQGLDLLGEKESRRNRIDSFSRSAFIEHNENNQDRLEFTSRSLRPAIFNLEERRTWRAPA